MLSAAQAARLAGGEVVIGYVEPHGRANTEGLAEKLERLPTLPVAYRGMVRHEFDLDAALKRRPGILLVDELAHSNLVGGEPPPRHPKRWQDIEELLDGGINVWTTLNVQHLESLNDVVADVTAVRQRETVPDWVVDLADQIELVDMSPHALQRRMLHGNVYPDPVKAELALQRYFTTENLTALRELALMRVANQVDETLLSRWSKGRTPETRERVLVCVGEPASADDLVRRGARIAQRARGDLLVVHARGRDEPEATAWLVSLGQLVADLGGELLVIDDEDPVAGVLNVAYTQFVTQLVVGESRRSRWKELMRGSFVNELIRQATNVDIHVIARHAR
jgi:two-component system sensor histidine kinase KdpD